MHAATVLFALSAIFGKLIVSQADVLVCGRALFAVAALGFVCLVQGTSPWSGVDRQGLGMQVFSGLLLTGHYVTFFHAIKLGGVAVGTLGFACFPAFATLCEAVVFREKPRTREYVLLCLVTAGLLLIAPSFSLEDDGTAGLVWGVVSGAVYSVLAVANRLTAARLSGERAAWWQNVVMLVCLLPLTGAKLPRVSPEDWLWMAGLGVLCTAGAYTLYVNSLTRLKARLAAMIIALEPVYSIGMAWIVFQDVPGPDMILGGLLILGAVAWAGRR